MNISFNAFKILLLTTFLYSCSTQPPAPIDFKDTKHMEDISRYYKVEDKDSPNLLEEFKSDDNFFSQVDTESKNLDKQVDSEKLDFEIKQALAPKKKTVASEDQNGSKVKIIKEVTKVKVLDGLISPLTRPVEGELVKGFSSNHKAISIASNLRQPVKAVYDGQIIYAGYDNKFGNLVIMKIKNTDFFVALAYMDDILVAKGKQVLQGDLIGHVGQTGEANKPQLYLALKKAKEAIDPLPYFSYKSSK